MARSGWHDGRVTLPQIRTALRAAARPGDAEILRRFFKTGPGEYGEGDEFLGVRVPVLRVLVRDTDSLRQRDVLRLLRSQYHEERLLALLILVRRFERGDASARRHIFNSYLQATRHINNWDLVDLSTPNIAGVWLLDRPRGQLRRWAQSANLWERRIAIVATLAFIRVGQFDDTLALCRVLKRDPHDLIHKACGWMLREVGKRAPRTLDAFLRRHAASLPRTMLRYAIERLPEPRRRAWLARGAVPVRQTPPTDQTPAKGHQEITRAGGLVRKSA